MDQKTKDILDALVSDGVIDTYYVTNDGDETTAEKGETYVGRHRVGVAAWWPFSNDDTQRLKAVTA